MKLTTNVLIQMLYQPKKYLNVRTALVCLLVAALSVGAVYLKQRSAGFNFRPNTNLAQQDLDPNMVRMQAHIDALNSRIKHLSIDNKRLSTTGQKLSAQLRDTSSSIKNKIAQHNELQLELYAIDQHLIRKYDAFIEQQKAFAELKTECEKTKNKSIKCQKYPELKQELTDSVAQIKFLKAKREVILSEIERTTAGI